MVFWMQHRVWMTFNCVSATMTQKRIRKARGVKKQSNINKREMTTTSRSKKRKKGKSRNLKHRMRHLGNS